MARVLASTSPGLAVSQPFWSGSLSPLYVLRAWPSLSPSGAVLSLHCTWVWPVLPRCPRARLRVRPDFGEGPCLPSCCGLSLPHAQGGAGPGVPAGRPGPLPLRPPTASASLPPSRSCLAALHRRGRGASWAPGSTEQPGRRAEGPAGRSGGVSPQPSRTARTEGPGRAARWQVSDLVPPCLSQTLCTKATMQTVRAADTNEVVKLIFR